MRLITKIILAIVAVIGIIEALVVAAFWWPIPWIRLGLLRYAPVSRVGILTLAGIVFAASLILLLVALLRRTRQPKLSVERDRGRVSVSQQAVENAVARAVKTEHNVKDVDVQVALHQRDGARAKITADPRQPADLVELAKAIETTARQQLTNVLGVPAKHVAVTLRPT